MSAPTIGESLNSGVDFMKKNVAMAAIGYFLLAVVGGLTMGICTGPLLVGYMRAVKKHRNGEKPEIGDVFSGFDSFVPALIVGLLGGILVMVGSMLCIIPGLLAIPMVMAAFYYVANDEKDGIAALKNGWALVKPTLVMAAVTVFVLSLIGGLGMIACYIGMFFTYPIALAGSYHYIDGLAGGAPAGEAAGDDDAEPAPESAEGADS